MRFCQSQEIGQRSRGDVASNQVRDYELLVWDHREHVRRLSDKYGGVQYDTTPGQTNKLRSEGLRTSDDELHILTRPITRARAQQLQQTMQGLVLRILDEPSTGIHVRNVNIIQVQLEYDQITSLSPRIMEEQVPGPTTTLKCINSVEKEVITASTIAAKDTEQLALAVPKSNGVDYNEDWIIDYGCSNHMTSDERKLRSTSTYRGNNVIVLADNTKLPIANIGKAEISPKLNSMKLQLRNAYHVPRKESTFSGTIDINRQLCGVWHKGCESVSEYEIFRYTNYGR
ncbi:hypothetical protein CRG98_031396 [Punica granatum]|uniref:Retrovirus-related Pol polyprotein from transposon TNT 1-94-like beta-barrel domain-containing protein n=1 Tax=Punica granatum TaxID=22663 RepID=A0A2I0IW12_PUNGR|nr:hypothetical protein CRG98_031396 [Punica granatum]